MKVYRIIGAVFSSILMPIFIVLLCTSLLITSAANLVTKKSIDAIVGSAMENEEMKNSVSDMVIESLYGGENIDDPQMKESIDKIMELPSVQSIISGIVSDSADEITSGSFDGELNVQEKLQNTLTEDSEILPTLSKDIVNVMMESESFRDTLVESLLGEGTADSIGGELMDELLQDPAVQEVFAKIVMGTLQSKLNLKNVPTVNIADEMLNFVSENPVLAEEVIDTILSDGESFDLAVAEAAAYAEENGLPAPAADITKLDFAVYYLELYREELNASFQDEVYNSDVDYTNYAPEATPEDKSNDLSIEFDEETVNTLNEFAEILNTFKSPLFILAIFGVFLFYYLLATLLTCSFRYPLIFSGIASIVTGISLIVVAMIPISDILAASTGEGAESLALALVASIWGVLANKLMLIGTLGIVLGIVLITVFIITGILIKNKAHEAMLAEIKENTPAPAA